MKSFHLQIVTPDGMQYDADALRLSIRTKEGDVGILAGHVPYIAALGNGITTVLVADDVEQKAACFGGLITVTPEVTRVVASSFQWASDIDHEKALAAKKRAELMLEEAGEDKVKQATAKEALNHADIRITLSQKSEN